MADVELQASVRNKAGLTLSEALEFLHTASENGVPDETLLVGEVGWRGQVQRLTLKGASGG